MSVYRLKIISINVNSIVTIERRSRLLNFINKHAPDILLICETKLNKTHKIIFEHYNIIRTDRKNATLGGGTAILIKRTLKYTKLITSAMNGFECLETTTISLNIQDGNKLNIISAYAPHSSQPTFQAEFQKVFEALKLDDPHNYYIFAGDFNARHTNWLNPTNNPRGVFINTWMKDHHIDYKCNLYTPKTPTYPRGNSYLDVCFADSRVEVICGNIQKDNELDSIITGLPVLPYDSDHYAISLVCSLENDTHFILDRREETLVFDYRKTNWKKLQKTLSKKAATMVVPNDRNLTNCEIDQTIDAIDQQIEASIEKVVPRIKPNNNMAAFSTPIIRHLQTQKSKVVSEIFKIYRSNQGHNNPQLATLKSI